MLFLELASWREWFTIDGDERLSLALFKIRGSK